uniref:Net n=1 Tax=Gerris buenoi TaxID=56086 RepID=A0A4Q8KEV9_GERBU|nr:net [Gerris buenoi]
MPPSVIRLTSDFARVRLHVPSSHLDYHYSHENYSRPDEEMACDVVVEAEDKVVPEREGKRKRDKVEEDEEEDEGRGKKKSRFRPWAEPLSKIEEHESQERKKTAKNVKEKKSEDEDSPEGQDRRRNYKNMTRERRIEANARERTRVHTISAAFETLRRAVPSYSHNQKLSKLSVLRVAASYILTLSRVIGKDYSADGSSPSVERCVENVSNNIQMEGKLRKKKDE